MAAASVEGDGEPDAKPRPEAKVRTAVKTEIESMMPSALWRRLRSDWLVVDNPTAFEQNAGQEADKKANRKADRKSWISLVESRLHQLAQYATEHSAISTSRPLLLIADSDPTDFLASFWAGLLAEWDIALANPHWGQQEWQSVSQQLSPNLTWPASASFQSINRYHKSTHWKSTHWHPFSVAPKLSTSVILIPTGGSSGSIKFAQHSWSSLLTAALGFCQHFQADGSPINAYCVLPLYHVSGLMQAIRTLISGGQLFITPFKALLSPSSAPFCLSLPCPPFTYLSLVPTQLERLLRADQSARLRQFHSVLLGGAPPWPSLIERAIAEQIPLYLSYGMTETGAMVTAIRVDPSAALCSGGASDESYDKAPSSGQVLPHAAVHIERDGQCLPPGELGQIVVRSGAIAQGYYSLPSSAFALKTFYTDDLGYLDAAGALHITGRASRKIISGGENIFSAEVEAALRSTGQVSDVIVLGLPHLEWGEVVTAVYVPSDDTVSAESLKRSLLAGQTTDQKANQAAAAQTVASVHKMPQLSRYKHPKQWIAVSHLPRNAQGKLDQAALLAHISSKE